MRDADTAKGALLKIGPMRQNQRASLSLFIWLVLFGLGIAPGAVCAPPTVAVIYPEVREPYRSVFRSIIKGVEEGLGHPAKRFSLKQDYDVRKLQDWLEAERIQAVVALGRRGLQAAQALPATLEIVVGGVLEAPRVDRFTAITLTPDPEALFDRLKTLAPGVTRVTVVYSPERSSWLIELANRAAQSHGITLNSLPAKDLREAALLYRDVLADQAGGSEAIWLPQDALTVDERAILPLILKKAWNNNLVVFSSNPTHVRRGALFSLYPDNRGMGRSLAALALRRLKDPKSKGAKIAPLQDVLIAVNLRTANHLGLEFESRQRREFDLVFPSP